MTWNLPLPPRLPLPFVKPRQVLLAFKFLLSKYPFLGVQFECTYVVRKTFAAPWLWLASSTWERKTKKQFINYKTPVSRSKMGSPVGDSKYISPKIIFLIEKNAFLELNRRYVLNGHFFFNLVIKKLTIKLSRKNCRRLDSNRTHTIFLLPFYAVKQTKYMVCQCV